MPEKPADDVYGQLIAINQSAFAEGDYDTACHALESALARAHYVQDEQGLSEIGAIAQEQEAQLATLPLSERIPGTADQRRHASRLILTSLITEVPTMKSLIEHERSHARRRLPREKREVGS